VELAEKVVKYYSFKNDVVLDPFAGTGTVGRAAVKLKRRFVLFEQDTEYMNIIREEVHEWLHHAANQINWINTEAGETNKLYLKRKILTVT
jgi:DNA modification methylase